MNTTVPSSGDGEREQRMPIAGESEGSWGKSEVSVVGISLVKDEADIIRLCLEHASRFCRRIFVLDNGSSDGTWHIVNRLAEEGDTVVPVGREPVPFAEGLRALAYRHARAELEEGDWVLLLDSDEFLEEDPRPLLEKRPGGGWNLVRFLQAQFFVTERDLEESWFLEGGQVHDFNHLPRHYSISWSEVRMFRHSESVEWPVRSPDGSLSQKPYPEDLSDVAPYRLVNRHYQYRSLDQMKRRLEIRARVHRESGRFRHNSDPNWRRYVRDHRKLDRVEPGDVIRATWRDRLRVWYRRQKKSLPRRARRALRRRLDRWLPQRHIAG